MYGLRTLIILLAGCALLHTCAATGAAGCRNGACFKSDLKSLTSEFESRKQFNLAGYTIGMDNRTFDLSLRDAGQSRGMKKTAMRFLPFLLVPALAMAGVMPWILPPLKMVVMFVAMINNMAFTSSLFMLIRNYVFNRKEEEHIFYVNHGYKNHGHHHR